MVVDVVVQNPQKSNVHEYEKKHVRSAGIYSGKMYGCVRYVLRVARVDSGWGYCSWRNDGKKVVFEYPASSRSAWKLRRGPFMDDE